MPGGMVDWGAGRYETVAAELDPAAAVVVQLAAVASGEGVLDLGCGTGNAALRAAAAGAHVVAVDAAPRLLSVARARARDACLQVDVRPGDLLAVPLEDGAVDVVVSVFGIIYAPDPGAALREVRRVLRPGGRALVSAWVPAGPIDAMLRVFNRIVGRITDAPSRPPFAWFDPAIVGPLAGEAALTLRSTATRELPIRAESPEAYVVAGEHHPMAVAVRPAVERAAARAELRAEMTAVVSGANEDPAAFLVHSPYVVHVLDAA
jgi:SAM-dependent methyltransferase